MLGCTFALCTDANAQSNRDSASRGKTFTVASWSDWNGPDLYTGRPKRSGESSLTKLSIEDMSYSPQYPYKPGEPLVFYKKTDDPNQPYVIALKTIIPSSCKKPLIFLIPRKKGPPNHLIYDLDSKDFPFGSVKVVNLTTKGIFANVGGKQFQVKPKSSKLVQPLKQSSKPKAVSCKLAVNNNGKPKPVYSSMMMARPYMRALLFIYPTKDEAGRQVIRCRSLNDFKPRPNKSS